MYKIALALTLMFTITTLAAQDAKTIGPEKGSLVIVGGGHVGDDIIAKFVELAGGKDAKMVIIPTAAGGEIDMEENWFANRLKAYGASDVTIIHTYDAEVADSDLFTEPLKNASAVWFGGGRQWRLVDAYAGTKTEDMFWEVLNRGGVIGGSSAGATIQGSYLARGDTQNNQIMMGDHEEGFGFVRNIAIDQHVLARNRQFDMFDILKNRPELLGIGIDEGTAVIVRDHIFEVVGESKVLIYDGSFWSSEGTKLKTAPPKKATFYFLQNGDRYNLPMRKVMPRR